MAGRTDLSRKVFRRGGGTGIRRREDVMFAVAIGTCRRRIHTRGERRPVYAPPVLHEHIPVAPSAGGRDVLSRDI